MDGRVVSVTTSPIGTAFINFGGEYPQSKVRWIHCGGDQDSARSATHYDPREDHQHHRHNPTSRREARDRDRVGRSGQRPGFSNGTVKHIPSKKFFPRPFIKTTNCSYFVQERGETYAISDHIVLKSQDKIPSLSNMA